jgi:hypothetical protein
VALAAGERIVRAPRETLAIGRGAGGSAIAVLAGPRALPELLAHDVDVVARELVTG